MKNAEELRRMKNLKIIHFEKSFRKKEVISKGRRKNSKIRRLSWCFIVIRRDVQQGIGESTIKSLKNILGIKYPNIFHWARCQNLEVRRRISCWFSWVFQEQFSNLLAMSVLSCPFSHAIFGYRVGIYIAWYLSCWFISLLLQAYFCQFVLEFLSSCLSL